LAASPLRSEAANAAEELIALLVLIKVRFLSPPYSNCCGSTCLTDVGTEGRPILRKVLKLRRGEVRIFIGLCKGKLCREDAALQNIFDVP